MGENPPFLIQQDPRLSVKEAEKIVDSILLRLGIKFHDKGKNNQFIIKGKGTPKEEKKKYFELVKQVRTSGVCGFLQTDLDRNDPVFGNTFGLGTPTPLMKLKVTWAGYEKELTGPCRSVPSEMELSNDIEFYKDETCYESSDTNFDMCVRNYRGYLFSSLALVDSYINRHIILFEFNGLNSKQFLELKASRNAEKRIELFVNQFCTFSFENLRQSKPWEDFKKLKKLRNEIVHGLNPYIGIELREIASNLNLSINGVGSLLKKMQEGQDRLPLTFIERVRTSPIIHYNEVTLKADGTHLEKKYLNKITR